MTHDVPTPEIPKVMRLAAGIDRKRGHENAFRDLITGSLKPVAPGDSVNWERIAAMDKDGEDLFDAIWGKLMYNADDPADHPARHYLDRVCVELAPHLRGGSAIVASLMRKGERYYRLASEQDRSGAWDEFVAWCQDCYDPTVGRMWRQMRSMDGPHRPRKTVDLVKELGNRLKTDFVAECRGELMTSRTTLLHGTIGHLIVRLRGRWRVNVE